MVIVSANRVEAGGDGTECRSKAVPKVAHSGFRRHLAF